MYLLYAILFSATTSALTTRSSIIYCTNYGQCPSTHYCNTQQRVCVIKRSVAGLCTHDIECSSKKCHENICRRTCKVDADCSLTKEYCSNKNFCSSKHCSFCTRDVQCVNNRCQLFHCKQENCLVALATLQRQ